MYNPKKMKRNLPLLLVLAIMVAAALPAKSQNTDRQEAKEKSEGLRKISSTRPDYKFEVRIDKEQLEATIEKAIENALRSVETALESIEIEIEDIEINLNSLEMNSESIIIDIPDIDVSIDLDELDIDLDEDDFDFDNDDWDNNDWGDWDEDDDRVVIRKQYKNEQVLKIKNVHKSDKGDEKEKSKGLKKIN